MQQKHTDLGCCVIAQTLVVKMRREREMIVTIGVMEAEEAGKNNAKEE